MALKMREAMMTAAAVANLSVRMSFRRVTSRMSKAISLEPSDASMTSIIKLQVQRTSTRKKSRKSRSKRKCQREWLKKM